MKTFKLLILSFILICPSAAQSVRFAPDNNTLLQFLENQDYASAADYLKTISPSDPDNTRYLSMLGYVYYMSHQFPKAETCYEKIFTADSSNATACNYLGNINLQKGNRPRALYFFCRLVDLKPGVASYYKQVAELLELVGNRPAATYYYQLAYSINQNDAEVTVGLANGWLAQKMYRQADSILDVALQRDSLQQNILEARINSAYIQEKYKTIFPLADKLKTMNAITLHPFFCTAAAYYLTKQYQQCIEICDLLIMNELKSRSLLYLEALAYEKQKKYELSLAVLDECIGDALSKDAVDYFITKGEIYEKLNENKAAIKQYDTAYYIFQSPVVLYKKGLVFDLKLKNSKSALQYYNAYLHQRRDSVPQAEKPVYQYVVERVKALRKWQAALK